MKNKLSILTSGGFLIALALLLLNDHYLKAACPGVITGKLSDFAGLFIFTVFIYAIASRFIRAGRQLVILHLAIAAGFIIWKIAPVELIFIEINKLLPVPLPSRIKDPTDLLALAILPLSYAYIVHIQQKVARTNRLPRLRRLVSASLLTLTCFAIIATSSGRRYDIQPNLEYQTGKDWSQIRELFEQTLADHKVQIKSSHAVNDTAYTYKIYFKEKEMGKNKKGQLKYREFTGFITLSYSPSSGTISFGNIYGWVINDKPPDNVIDKAYMNTIIEPFLDSMKR